MMECQLKLSYKQQKTMKKLLGKHRAFEIALGRKLVNMIKKNYEVK